MVNLQTIKYFSPLKSFKWILKIFYGNHTCVIRTIYEIFDFFTIAAALRLLRNLAQFINSCLFRYYVYDVYFYINSVMYKCKYLVILYYFSDTLYICITIHLKDNENIIMLCQKYPDAVAKNFQKNCAKSSIHDSWNDANWYHCIDQSKYVLCRWNMLSFYVNHSPRPSLLLWITN